MVTITPDPRLWILTTYSDRRLNIMGPAIFTRKEKIKALDLLVHPAAFKWTKVQVRMHEELPFDTNQCT